MTISGSCNRPRQRMTRGLALVALCAGAILPLPGCASGRVYHVSDLIGPVRALPDFGCGQVALPKVYLEVVDSQGERTPFAESLSVETRGRKATVKARGDTAGIIELPLVSPEDNPEVRITTESSANALLLPFLPFLRLLGGVQVFDVQAVEFTLGVSRADQPVRTVLIDGMQRRR